MLTRLSWLATLVLASVFFLAPAAYAQTYTYSLYLDVDSNSTTGCSAGPVNGAELRIDTTVTGGTAPLVTQVSRTRCEGASFGSATLIGGGYPVGIGNGTGGGDVIELADELSQLAAANVRRLSLSLIAHSDNGTDELLAGKTGAPIVIGMPAFALPLLGVPALLLLITLFALLGGRVAYRKAALRSLVALVMISGIALAANFVVDGQVGDWNGVNPLATDPAGDATSGESAIDLRALYGAIENNRAYFRIDVSNLRNAPPIADPVSATTLEDNAITLSLSGSDPEGAAIDFAITSAPLRGTLSAITMLTPTTASVVYTPNVDANGNDSFQFTADDGQGISVASTASITITPVNDAPSFTAQDPPAVDEDAGAQTAIVATNILPGPITATDESAQQLDFIISANSNPSLFDGLPSIDASGLLSYTPADDATGTATLTIALHDDGGIANGGVDTSASQTITITVQATDDAPIVTAGGSLTYTEGDAAAIVDAGVSVTDLDSTDLASASVQIETNYQNGNDVLSFANTATISGTFNAANGTLTLSGSDSVANYQIALRNVRYANTSDNPTTATRSLRWIANDGSSSSNPATSTITVIAINDAPVVTAGGTLSYTEGAAATAIDVTATVTDPDNTNLVSASVQIGAGFVAGQDELVFVNANGITGSFNATSGLLNLTGAASVADYQTALRSVSYRNSSSDPSTLARTVSWLVNDGTAASAPVTSTINVTVVNNAPVVTAGGTLSYTENDIATIIDGGVTLTDADNANLASASVQISAGFVTGEDVLAFTSANGIVGSFNAATGVLDLAGASSVANYQAALRSVTYANSSNDPTTTARTISWIANDGATASTAATSTITIAAVNDAPVVTAGGTLSYTENDVAAIIDGGVTVTDADNANLASATVQLSTGFVTGEDVLAFTNANGISGSFNAASGLLTLSGSASVANYQTALRSVSYFNSSNDPGTAQRNVTWIVNDGAVASTPATSTITIAAINDAPLVTASGSVSYTEADPAVLVGPTVTVTDADNTDLAGATVQITTGLVSAEDVLAFTASGGISGSYDAASGTLTLSGTASVANYQTALRNVSYVNSSNNPSTSTRTLSWIATDGTSASTATTSQVTVVTVNDAPVVTAGGSLAYTEGMPASVIDGSVSVTDADNPNLASASVQISTGFVSAEDVLSFTNTATISGVFSATTGTLTLSGSDTVANYQAALRNVRYANSSSDPTTTPRTVTWLVNDGTDTSAPVTSAITVNAVNNAPVVTAGGTLSYTENDVATVIDGGVTVSDADNANLASASVQISAGFVTGEDVLTFTSANGIVGSFNAATGVLDLAGASSVANYQTALRSITYANSSNDPSTATRTISWIANDGTAASTAATSTITIATINDAPVVTAGGTLSYTENDVAAIIDGGVTVTDADNTNLASATVQISTGFVTGEDVLAFTNANGIIGSFNAASGLLTLSGSASVANYQTALRSVTYVNSSNDPSTAQRTVTWIVNDGALASNSSTSTITVSAVNDAPIVVAGGSVSYIEADPAVLIGPAVSVSDADDTNLVGASVQITSGLVSAEDVLAFSAGGGITGSYNASNGTLTLIGTASVAAYQAALRTVTYRNSIALPTTSTRTIVWTATDGDDASTPVTSQVNVQRLNEAPVVVVGGSLSYTEGTPAQVIAPGLTVTDANDANLVSATVQISSNFVTGEDVLSFVNGAGITGNFNGGNGTLTLSGTSTVANYQTALRSVRYQNTSSNPSTNSRTLSWTANDGQESSAVATSAIAIIAVNSPPIASAPSALPVHTHIAISVAAGGTGYLLNPANITDPDSSNFTIGTPLPTATVLGGTVSINAATGAYTYDPPAGLSSGNDSFQYRVCDDGTPNACTALLTMQLNVSGPRIWFVNAAGAPGGVGTQSRPLLALAAGTAAANTSGDTIFLHSGAYTGGVALGNGVRLFGQSINAPSFDAGLGITPPANSVPRPSVAQARPTITTTAANTAGITLGTGNTLRAIEIGNTTGPSILGNAFGSLTVVEGVHISGSGQALALNNGSFSTGSVFASISSSSSPANNILLNTLTGSVDLGSGSLAGSAATNPSVLIIGGSLTLSYSGSISKTTSGIAIDVTNRSGGTMTLSGNLSATAGAGIRAAANPGGSLIFSGSSKVFSSGASKGVELATNGATVTISGGGLNITTANAIGFSAGGTGTFTVEGPSNRISTTQDTAFYVDGSTFGAAGATFESVSSSGGGVPGIMLNNTGTAGGLRVTGTGATAGSGGTIQNKTGRGVSLQNTSAVLLKNMNLTNTASSNGNATPANCGPLATQGANATCSAAISMNTVSNVTLDTVSINGSAQNGINGLNVANLQILNSSVINAGNETEESGVMLQNLSGTNNLVSNSSFSGSYQHQFALKNFSGALGTAVNPFNIRGSTFVGRGNTTTTAGDGFHGLITGASTAHINIGNEGSTPSAFRSNYSYAINFRATNTSTASLTVDSANFGTLGTTPSYNNSGILAAISDGAQLNYTLSNNRIYGSAHGSPANGVGIVITTGTMSGTTALLRGTISGNIIGDPSFPLSGCNGNCDGIDLFANGGLGPMSFRSTVTNNQVHQVDGFGIRYIGGTETSAVAGNLRVSGNTLTGGSQNFQAIGIAAAASGVGGAVSTLCADIGIGSANVISGIWDGSNGDGIRVITLRGSIFTVGGMPASANASTATVTGFVSGNNGGIFTSGSNTASGGGIFNSTGAACPPL